VPGATVRYGTVADSMMQPVSDRLAAVRRRITEAGGDPAAVTVVAVTKALPVDAVRAATAAGLHDVGENYAQEVLAKADQLGDEAPRWHFLGRLQTNKVRHLAPHVRLWQSVDRAELVREIAKRAPGADVLVQVNLSGEAQKGGCSFDEVPFLVGLARDEGLDVRGLMGVGPAGPPAAARPGFDRLVGLASAMDLPVRSIGMSGDLEVAVAAGATMVRIGRDLFGPRPLRAEP
jgi:pyridoxal phosphate enzyme (YggS family)